MVDFIVNLFAPWASFYNDHELVATWIAFFHLAGLLWGGGRAVVADVVTLRSSSAEAFLREGNLRFLMASHRDVIVGLAISAITGVLMFGSDVEHYLGSWLYWVKIALVVILLLNGVFIQRTEARLGQAEQAEPAWGGARRHAWISLACWFGATLFGKLMVTG
ncbi:MAG: hypothetical protein R2882_06585 [Gemmatimonadales bacterium]